MLIFRFAHCINVEFYHDLVKALDNLIENENLGFKEKLCCVHTVFTILFYQGATIYLDPSRFYTHLYATLIHLNAGKYCMYLNKKSVIGFYSLLEIKITD